MSFNKKILVELIGAFFLVAAIVGSGIMGELLVANNKGVILLGNMVATGSILFVLIKVFAPISGAHFNPIVSFVFYLKNEIKFSKFIFYSTAQIIGGLFAILFTHYIFGMNIFQISNNIRGEERMMVSEILSTFGLISIILILEKNKSPKIAEAVSLYIMAGYWFTSSTSFANPAVTISRIFTDSFSGIHPSSFIYFLFGQIIGGVVAFYFVKYLYND